MQTADDSSHLPPRETTWHRWQRRLLEEAHDSFVRHVVRPNPHASYEAFAHSWNPSLRATIDRLYAPVASLHERERMHDYGNVARSALASIRWAVTAKRRHERARGKAYDLAMLMRYDLAFHSRLEWPSLPAAQIWGLAQCCPWLRSPMDVPTVLPSIARAKAVVTDVCLGPGQGEPMDYCRVSRNEYKFKQLHAEEAELNYVLNDWLLLAPSPTLDTLRHLLPEYASYDAALAELGIRKRWLHGLLAAHVHDALAIGGGMRAIHAHVSLMRNAQNEGCYVPNASTSLAHLLPPPREPLLSATRHLCPWRGAIRCHFHSIKCALLRDSPVVAA